MRKPIVTVQDTLQGRVFLVVLSAAVSGAAGAQLGERFGVVWPVALLSALAAGLMGTQWLLVPVTRRLRAIANAVDGLADGDFAIAVKRGGGDEVNTLIDAFNATTAVMREERLSLYQRELLLDTVVQTSPIAMVLLDARQHVVYANVSARRLLNEGQPVRGMPWASLCAKQSEAAAEALRYFRHGIFDVPHSRGESERYMLRSKQFVLNARQHTLVLVESLTRELNRQEVANWKKVIRVISHELNNSVAPISSLLHSSQKLHERGDHARVDEVLSMTIERTTQLKHFIDRYARFARLPEPEINAVQWFELLESVGAAVTFRFEREMPIENLWADRAQIEQVLINLLRNAHQSGSDPGEVTLAIDMTDTSWRLSVSDRGPGMSETVMAHALVPFYSTRTDGSGIGLALSREIVEAHGGRISLQNREDGGLSVQVELPRRNTSAQ